jgi:hypothetical protein
MLRFNSMDSQGRTPVRLIQYTLVSSISVMLLRFNSMDSRGRTPVRLIPIYQGSNISQPLLQDSPSTIV